MLNYKIVIGDSRSMREVESNSVDYIVTSPPYWNLDVFSEKGEEGWEKDLSQIISIKEFFKEITKTWAECHRVLRPGGYLTCEWEDYPVGSRFYGYAREIALCGPMVDSIEKSGLYLICRRIWHKWKGGAGIHKTKYSVYGNLNVADPRATVNWAYVFTFKKKEMMARKRRLDFTREEWIKWHTGIWYLEAGTSGAGKYISGGAVFPESLVRRLLKIFSNPGDTILDPFLGSGTTMQVSFKTRRSCIGYEVLPRMLPKIKSKTKFGIQPLDEEGIKWEVIRR